MLGTRRGSARAVRSFAADDPCAARLEVPEGHRRQREDANGGVLQPHVELTEDATGAHRRHGDVDAAEDEGEGRVDALGVGHVHQRGLGS